MQPAVAVVNHGPRAAAPAQLERGGELPPVGRGAVGAHEAAAAALQQAAAARVEVAAGGRVARVGQAGAVQPAVAVVERARRRAALQLDRGAEPPAVGGGAVGEGSYEMVSEEGVAAEQRSDIVRRRS